MHKFDEYEDEILKQKEFKEYAILDKPHAMIRKGNGFYQCYC